MSNTIKGEKGPGYDYWSRRPGNESGCNSPTSHKFAKKVTHRKERVLNKRILRESGDDYNE